MELTIIVHRTVRTRLTLAAKDGISVHQKPYGITPEDSALTDSFKLNAILVSIWEEVKKINKVINENEPWNKTPEVRREFLVETLEKLFIVGNRLSPFMPKTGELIVAGTNGSIAKVPPLFPRLSK